jgi:tetratricopeptide (TPR) repeat protein
MSDDWYVRKGHKTLGPLTEVEVRHVLESGRIDPETPVRQGANGSWTPAGQALTGRKGPISPARSKKKPRIAMAAAGLAVLLLVGLWVTFRGGHRELPPAAVQADVPPGDGHDDVPPTAATASPADATKATAVTATKSAVTKSVVVTPPAIEISPVGSRAAAPVGASQSLVAAHPSPERPSLSTASGTKATVARPASPANPPRAEVASKSAPQKSVQSQPKPADVATKPRAPIVKVAPDVPSAPATQADLAALESAALRSSTAKDALALYQQFRATRAISPAAADLFQANLQVWEVRAGEDLVRLGDQWVAVAVAAKARQESAQLVQQAYELTKALNFDEARRTLESASRVDPNSIAADFSVGILTSISPAKFRSSLTAAKHFEVVLERSPGYLPALNNLALAEIHEEKYAEAVGHLRQAAEHTPVPEEVAQNLGRFLSETQLGRIHPNPPVLAEATELYSRVAATKPGVASAERPKHGWRYLPFVLPTDEREELARLEAAEAESTAIVQGTGLVVAPHYLITCRHVIDDFLLGRADRIEVVDPRDLTHERRLPAICVAVDEADDLCLLKCDGLNVPSLALAENLPPRGTETLLLDVSEASASGTGWKVTQGLVTALPGDVARVAVPRGLDFSRLLWSDAVAGHRANGGALCDDHGNIIAIQSTSFGADADARGHDASHAKYAGAIPASLARAFVRSSLPAFAHAPLGGPALSWSEVRGKVGPSLVSVVAGYRKVVMMMSKPDALDLKQSLRQAEALYDDHCCTVCNGRARVLCRAPGCQFARLHDEHVPHDPNMPKPSLRHRCPTCLGTGYVRCPHCSIGIDPLLR